MKDGINFFLVIMGILCAALLVILYLELSNEKVYLHSQCDCKGDAWLTEQIDSIRNETRPGSITKARIAGILEEMQCQEICNRPLTPLSNDKE